MACELGCTYDRYLGDGQWMCSACTSISDVKAPQDFSDREKLTRLKNQKEAYFNKADSSKEFLPEKPKKQAETSDLTSWFG